jgi:hypothetical protein
MEFYLCLAYSTKILDVVELGDKTYATACDYGLSEAHLVHTIVYEHLDIVNLNNLVPHIRE